jgi:chromosome segregation ATPase
MQTNAPVYVRIHEYDEVLATIETVKQKLSDAHGQLKKLQELKAQEDKEVASWAVSLGEVQQKLDALETNLKQ